MVKFISVPMIELNKVTFYLISLHKKKIKVKTKTAHRITIKAKLQFNGDLLKSIIQFDKCLNLFVVSCQFHKKNYTICS